MKRNLLFTKKILLRQIMPVAVFLLSSIMLHGQSLHVIEVRDFQFDPSELTITAGDTVEWRNEQGSHNVNGTQETFSSNPESFGNDTGSGWVYQHVFTIAGNYDYQCDPHAAAGMNGSIIVQENGQNTEQHMLTVQFSEMDPHLGQDLYLAVREAATGMEIIRTNTVAASDFSVDMPGIMQGKSYHIDFWVDFNENGRYDTPPVDHAWRLELNDVTGDTTLMFVHNTDFTNIIWQNLLTVEFSGMNPHVGQDIYLAVVDTATGMEVGRTHAIADTAFNLMVPGIERGKAYHVDFWVDFNENGLYDAPPTDHAWRLDLNDVVGDTTLMFAHNTDFTDIMWNYMLTVEFSEMNPHLGQDVHLAVVDAATGHEIGRRHIVADTDFILMVPGIETGGSYHVDFWADFNDNGMYDAPPTDHAWRIELNDVMGDTTLMFVHNTDFTDIMWTNSLTVEFSGMNPHVGQDIYLAVVDAGTGREVGRTHALADTAFSMTVPGLEGGNSYHVDFWVDFNENGMYDAPPTDHAWRLEANDVRGDTTLMFVHNTDFTDIMWEHLLTVEFSGMNPHVGQDIYLAVVDTATGMEVARTHAVADTAFSIMVPGIVPGHSYHVDFWVDFNENGMYDTPPTDHAWRLNLNNVTGDTTLMFQHNTDFTDIMWEYQLTVEFSGMNPHVGQDLYLAVVNAATGEEIGRTHAVADDSFALMVPGLEPGESYHVDFWADFNENGMYDAPPTDHAWRLELNDVMGDTTLMFEHNTNFTDIMWTNSLTVEFSQMDPHEGQDIYLAVVDANTGMEVGRTHTVADTAFSMTVPGIKAGQSYHVDFWADFNENGRYDGPPTDHAWRLEVNDVKGDTTLMFVHNTDFTDIMWRHMLTVELSGMNPHVGQNIYLAVIDTLTGREVGRTHAVADTAFSLMVPGIEPGHSYHVDFWVDFNENGMYDAPPTDHAWRLNLNNVTGDTTLMFQHNTDFTDIMWKYQLTVDFTGMTPHVGQMLVLYVVNTDDDMAVDSVTIEDIADPAFSIHSSSLTAGNSYHINFYADFNENGMYDAPPTDHAWQLMLENVTGDTTLVFEHNTDFTDIFPVTSSVEIGSQPFRMYPNPATDKVWIESDKLNAADYTLSVFDISGRKADIKQAVRNNRIELNVRNLTKGIYFVELKTTYDRKIMKLIKK